MSIWQGLVGYGSTLYGAWKGLVGDDSLSFGTFDGTSWKIKPDSLPGNSSVGPALCICANNAIYAAWKGEDTDQRLFWARYHLDTKKWSEQKQLSDHQSLIGVSLAGTATTNTVYAGWRDANNDMTMRFAALDSAAANPSWTELPRIPGSPGDPSQSSIGPTLAVAGTTLYAFWADLAGVIHYAKYNTVSKAWSGGDAAGDNVPPLSDTSCSIGPSVVAVGDVLYLAWQNKNNARDMSYATLDNDRWTQRLPLPGKSTIGPALAAVGTTVYAMWVGPAGDQGLYTSTLDTTQPTPSWTTQKPVNASTGQDVVPPPILGLGGNSAYYFYAGGVPITGLLVSIETTQEIVCDKLGFHVQLNANVPFHQPTIWQQYVMGFDPEYNNPPKTPFVGCSVQYFGHTAGPSRFNNNPPGGRCELTGLPGPKTLPPNCYFNIRLRNDPSNGHVVAVQFSFQGPNNSLVWPEYPIPDQGGNVHTPILAFQVNIVGKNSGDFATMTSGAGLIGVSADQQLTVHNIVPPSKGTPTAENANSYYDCLPAGPSATFSQTWGVDPT